MVFSPPNVCSNYCRIMGKCLILRYWKTHFSVSFIPTQPQNKKIKGVQISFRHSWKRVGTVSLTNNTGSSWRKSSTAGTKQWAVISGGFHCLCTRIKWWTTCKVKSLCTSWVNPWLHSCKVLQWNRNCLVVC